MSAARRPVPAAVVAAATLIGLGTLGGVALLGPAGPAPAGAPDAHPAPPPTATGESADGGWRWRADSATVYALEWRHDGTARAFASGGEGDAEPQDIQAALLLRGELRVSVAAEEADGRVVLALTLPAVDHLAWRVMGTEVPAEQAVARYFAGRTAWLTVEPDGTPGALRFADDTPRSFARVISPVVRQAFPRPAPSGEVDRWETLDDTGLGRATTRWETVERKGPRTFVVTAARQASDYRQQSIVEGAKGDRLIGQGEGRFEVAGGRLERAEASEHLEVLDGAERLALAEVSVTLRYLRSEPVSAARPPARLVGVDALPSRARQDALDKRLRGMTFEQLAADLRQFGGGGVMPRHNAWLWRVTGWLERYPERTYEVAALFWDEDVGEPGQRLVLDLLASVGHAQAQASLRELLDDERVVARRDYVPNLQRLVMLSKPEAETAAMVDRRYEARRGDDVGRAAAVTLGAMAQRGVAGADDIVRKLAVDLDGATDLDDERALVRALGASQSPLAEPAIAARLDDPRAVIRAEAARALGMWDDPRAHELVASAVARERDPYGQKWALTALAEQDPSPAGLAALERMLTGGGLDRTNVYEALRIAEKAEDALGPEAVWPVAQALRAARVGDRAARSRVQSFVEALSARL